MKQIINLTSNAEMVMIKILTTYKENPFIELQRGEEHYTVKYDFPEGIAEIDVDVLPHYYLFSVRPENSALLMAKPNIPTFEVGLSMSNNHKLVWHKKPNSKEANEWLTRPMTTARGSTTRADSLIVFATVCQMIWSFLIPTMKVREYGDITEYAPRDDFFTFIDEWVKVLKRKHTEMHRLDGWDVVNLTQKQLEKIGETLEAHHILHDFDNVPLHRYCLSLYDGKDFMYYFMNHHGNTIHFEIEDSRTESKGHCDISYEKMADGQLSMELSDNTNVMEWLTKKSKLPDGEEVMYWQWMVDLFFSINSFMLNFGDVTMEVETKIAQEQTGNRQQRRQNKRNSVRLFKTYKLIKGWRGKARKKAEITCPAWGVRGHIRHYKNGKTVFIESYIKGKEKDKYMGKEYNLLPYKDA